MTTVKDVLDRNGGRGVLVHRHATYLSNPEGKVPADSNERAAQNYCGVWPDHANPLDQAGRDISVAQGARLAELGVPLDRILVSRQGRGPETGLYVAIGYLNANGCMPEIAHSNGADYPIYRDVGYTTEALRRYGDDITVTWLNGQLPELCRESPEQFLRRVGNAVESVTLAAPGPILMATHFEVVTAAHVLYVQHAAAGTIQPWVPQKSAGVLVVSPERGVFTGYVYDKNFSIVE